MAFARSDDHVRQQDLPNLGGTDVCDSFRDRRLDRTPVGRTGAWLPPPPRDLEHQLRLPYVWQADVRNVGCESQQLDLRHLRFRRGVAQQPSRLPAIRIPWNALVADRYLRLPDQAVGIGQAREERLPDSDEHPGNQADHSFTAPRVIPDTNSRCIHRNSRIIGSVESSEPAIS